MHRRRLTADLYLCYGYIVKAINSIAIIRADIDLRNRTHKFLALTLVHLFQLRRFFGFFSPNYDTPSPRSLRFVRLAQGPAGRDTGLYHSLLAWTRGRSNACEAVKAAMQREAGPVSLQRFTGSSVRRRIDD